MIERDPSRALRFLQEVENSLLILVESPYLGSLRLYELPTLHSLRRYQIPGFRNYGIIYRPLVSGNGIDIWRVLHAKQDDAAQLEALVEDDSD